MLHAVPMRVGHVPVGAATLEEVVGKVNNTGLHWRFLQPTIKKQTRLKLAHLKMERKKNTAPLTEVLSACGFKSKLK